jgi:hypothetical protein
MKDIGLVLNFEARGVCGPVFMFETQPGNGRVIREFARAAPCPVANSLMCEVYRQMPLDSDFTIFKRYGVPGLNFAFIGDAQHYHERTDDLAHVNLRSLQHDGTYALSLARRFGNLDLTHLDGPETVYFDLLGRVLVRYPAAWAVPLAVLAAGLWVAVTVLALKRHEASIGKLILGWLAQLIISLLVVALFRYGLAGGLLRNWPAWFYRLLLWPYWFISVGLTLAMNLASLAVWRRWLAPANLALGALFTWVILAAASARWLAGASYIGLWPLLFALLGVAAPRATGSWRRFAWLVLAALPALLLITPLVQQFYVALGPRGMFVPMVVLALEFGALLPQIEATLFARRPERPGLQSTVKG